jgi:peptide-methionine (R)-S-oxide reductase
MRGRNLGAAQGLNILMTAPHESPDHASPSVTRRAFVAAGMLGAAGIALAALRRTAIALPRPDSLVSAPDDVLIVSFDAKGNRTGAARVPKIVKPDAEWRKQLSPLAYSVTRHADTEYAFTGPYWDNHEAGLYRCICCDTALWSSKDKYDSGTGWPSFTKPLAKENIVEITDTSFGMTRTAISCARCDGHQGHVFDDGPPPAGLRYCINGVALRFVKFA